MPQPQPYTYRVKEVLRVVDGDTFDLRITFGFGQDASLRFRLADIDTPEMYGRAASAKGREAAEYTADWLADRDGRLVVRTFKGAQSTVGLGDGAFGRWLAAVVGPDGESLADALRRAGLAK